MESFERSGEATVKNTVYIYILVIFTEFGGDQSRITLFGQSAGGASVGFHLLQPLSWNYFNNAVMMVIFEKIKSSINNLTCHTL